MTKSISESVKTTIFRMYDIRGRIPDDFTVFDGYAIAHAILTYYQEQDRTLSAIVLGRDGRTTSPALAQQIHAAADDLNITIHDLGLVSSPEFYHALHTGSTPSGIMITASHNDAEYNGFKLRLNCTPVWGEQLQVIATNLAACNNEAAAHKMKPLCGSRNGSRLTTSSSAGTPTGMTSATSKRDINNTHLYANDNTAEATASSTRHPGSSTVNAGERHAGGHSITAQQLPDEVCRESSAITNNAERLHYTTDLAQRFAHLANEPLHAIIDCGNGATGPAVEQLIAQLNLPHITLLHTTPDGTFPNHKPDSSNAGNLTELIGLVKNAPVPTLGLALDGDGDRLGLVLEDGTHLSGDDLLALLAHPVLAQNPGTHVVYDIKSSSRLTRVIPALAGTGHFTPCGHTYIQDAMQKHNALIGGEVSGHLFFRDRYFGFDDGIYAALRVLELALQNNTTLKEQFAQLPAAYAAPEQRIHCEEKEAVVEQARARAQAIPGALLITTDGIRVELPEGWLLIRAAQTEPALSVRWEGTTQTATQNLEKLLRTLIAA